nr:CpaF family protein [Actinomycetales bacterium]
MPAAPASSGRYAVGTQTQAEPSGPAEGGPRYGDPRARAEAGPRIDLGPGGGTRNQLRSVASSSFWSEIDGLQARISVQLAEEFEGRGLTEEAQKEIGRRLIEETLREHVRALVAAGSPPWDAVYTQRVKDALLNKLFGLGRLQELVDDETVENIEITGFDQVLLLHSEGRRTVADPVAESDEQLIRDLAFIASRRSRSERSFTPSNPFLKLALPGGQRLQATAWVTPRPKVVIRRDRLPDIDLEQLREFGSLDRVLEQFLSAAVRAHKSIVVSGRGQGSGKTTLVRALANAMDPWESIATIETEYELKLHQMPERHQRVTAMEARPGSGEIGRDGRAAGEITVNELVYESLRFNIDRVIVGEVRGAEVVPMFKAMQMGNGSLSTIHANSAEDVIERLVTCAVEDASNSEAFAYRQVGQHIDLILFNEVEVDPVTGKRHRYLSEVIEVGLGEGERRVAVTHVFMPDAKGRAVPVHEPTFMAELVDAGFDRSLFGIQSGLWDEVRR